MMKSQTAADYISRKVEASHPLTSTNEGRHPENAHYFYHTDHLGSSAWITDHLGRGIQHFLYLPFGEPWVDQQNSGFHTYFTFSGKERDPETGYGYFGARYYSSDLGIWLSVDPMSDKYPSLSAYTYCANNPIKYWDPDGRWIPGLDEAGNAIYTAEKGDNLYTFQKQFGVGKKETLGIFNQSKISTADNASFQDGQYTINGSVVKEHTGSDVLKGRWSNLTNTQKASQIMFGMMYSEHHNQTADNGTYSMNIDDFVDGFYVGSSGLNLNNVRIPAKGGGTIQIDQMSISPSSTFGDQPLIYHGAYGGNEYRRIDGSTFASYHFKSAINKNATHPFKVINVSVPTGINDVKFRKSY